MKKLDRFVAIRRENGAFFQQLMRKDDRFIIQRENGKSSWFSFTIIPNPHYRFDRKKILKALKDNQIQYRIITGGNFLRHDVIRYFNYDTVGPIVHANIAHDKGFFVGNHPVDIKPQLAMLREVLDRTANE